MGSFGGFCRRGRRRRGCPRILCGAAVAFGLGLLLGLICSLRLAVICAAFLLIVMGLSILMTGR